MKTVAIYCSQYPPYAGGGPNYYNRLVKSLESEYRLIVLTSYHTEKNIITTEDKTEIYRIIPVVTWLPWIIRLILETVVSLITFTILLMRYRVDLLHAQSTSYAIPGIVVATILTRVPIIYDCRDEAFPPRAIQIGNTPLWFSASTNIDQQLVQAGIASEEIVRVPVVNPSYVSEYTLQENFITESSSFRVCFCGKFRPEKNVPLLIDAFANLLDKGLEAHLIIIGDGLTRSEVESRIKHHSVADRVEITGELPHREALRKLSECDVLVLPSESEGLPRVIMEALEIGIPVVTTDAGGITDIIEDKETGIIVELNERSIGNGLKKINENRDLRERLIKNGQAQVASSDWRQVVDRVCKAYDMVLQNE